ncbi:coiled-coil domain-containing protein 73 isoform X2 [Lepisosteus oculatus]|uniref:coiled-coil domain-containing protein 73 isoform X2 n=1 Tax=Lepisosteus oculatus TaxID=7918 RepID=UPI0035F50C4B
MSGTPSEVIASDCKEHREVILGQKDSESFKRDSVEFHKVSGNGLSLAQEKDHKTESDYLKAETSSPFSLQESADAIISVHMLECKTSLLEAVEELRIRRDAEIRFEDQINKLVLEKQELEWEKESLQNQTDTLKSQQTDALTALKKKFQARIRGIEGEKGKHQLTTELRDKEINSLKEELKSLQVFKFSLQKKLSELEQKLQLQTQTKDNHLNQISEAEKRFETISRQCVMVKQFHEKLEQNVEEAMRLNKKLTLVNYNQEATIFRLKKDIEKLNKELIKSRVSSHCKRGDESMHRTLQEQEIQQLQHKLLVETEMTKRLTKENATIREEKQEVMNSLKHAQQLLQRQTEAIGRVELELNAQREEHQALKRDNELFREKIKEKEDKFISLTEECQNSKAIWEKEQMRLQEKIQQTQEKLRSHKEAYDYLHEQHNQLSSCSVQQAEQIQMLKHNLKVFSVDVKPKKHNGSDNEIKEVCAPRHEVNSPLINDSQSKAVVLQSNNTQSLQDIDIEEKNIIEHFKDKCTFASSKEPAETVNDELSKADYCVVINVQTDDVYASGSKDTGGTKNICSTIDLASTTLKPQGSPDTLAEVPVTETMILDSADALGVYSADTGQQTDSSKHKSGIGESHLVYGMLDKSSTATTMLCNKGDFISELPSPKGSCVYHNEVDPVTAHKDCQHELAEGSPELKTQVAAKDDEDNQKCSESKLSNVTEVPEVKSALNEMYPTHLVASEILGGFRTPLQNDPKLKKITSRFIKEKSGFNRSDPADATKRIMTISQCYSKLEVKDQMTTETDDRRDKTPSSQPATNDSETKLSNQSETIEKNINSAAHNRSENKALVQTVTPDVKKTCTETDSNVDSGRGTIFESDQSSISHSMYKLNEGILPCTNYSEAHKNKSFKKEILMPRAEKTNLNEHQEDSTKNANGEIYFPSSDTMFTSESKKIRSAFELRPLKNIQFPTSQKSHDIHSSVKVDQDVNSQTSTPLIPSCLKRDTVLPPALHEAFSTKTNPKLYQDEEQNEKDSPTIKRAADMLNTSSIHPCHKRDPRDEWNAIAQTFCEISAEHKTTEVLKVPVSYSYMPTPAASILKKDSSINVYAEPEKNTPAACLNSHNKRNDTSAMSPESVSAKSDEDLEFQQRIHDEVSKIQKFLILERLRCTRKRKTDERVEEIH